VDNDTIKTDSDALELAKYMNKDRARFVLCQLLQSGAVSLDAFRDALAKRAVYLAAGENP
jgi:hypothetical protein